MSASADSFVSVVVPVWNDREELAALLEAFPRHACAETIVVVARDEVLRYRHLERRFDWVHWETAARGRGAQMDAGAALARGKWLLFLHADSRLPADWLDVIHDADQKPDVVAGAFRFALDSRDWRARLLEYGVRLRLACFQLPYGDQALFVRRDIFERVGGFRELPLMEDVDLIERLRSEGRLHFAASPVTTSARRWELDGWLKRSATNLLMLAKYKVGFAPESLMRQYNGRRSAAVIVMARAPWTNGKTRLRMFEDASHMQLRSALFEDTLDAIRSASEADHLIACEPPDESATMQKLVGQAFEVMGQRGDSLGDRLACAFDDAFRRGYRAVVIIGSDLPDVPSRILREALASLTNPADHMVIGPAQDGGYYLIGLNRRHRDLFRGIDWGTGHVLRQTLEQAANLELAIERVDEWSDIDDLGDLERFLKTESSAPRTREWIRQHRPEFLIAAETPRRQG